MMKISGSDSIKSFEWKILSWEKLFKFRGNEMMTMDCPFGDGIKM